MMIRTCQAACPAVTPAAAQNLVRTCASWGGPNKSLYLGVANWASFRAVEQDGFDGDDLGPSTMAQHDLFRGPQ
jgi:hypothetical protein